MARILVAEDEPSVRDFLKAALALDGHAVEAAADGAEAYEVLKGDPAFDLLLTDIQMPMMDGIALALNVARDHPDLPILLMTGYAHQRERAHGLDTLVKDVVMKPFTLDEIRKAVAAALA
ncbi:MAG: response regulator [Hyphomicrobiaceae bacterium]|nr:response regulator [Hyphomicrobiaceae bacterium]